MLVNKIGSNKPYTALEICSFNKQHLAEVCFDLFIQKLIDL